MRVLFTSMRMTGHIRPLLPFAHGLQSRGHEVVFATPEGGAAAVRGAGLAHAVFPHPGDEVLGPIWAQFRGKSAPEVIEIAVGRIFADLNPRAALPGLRETIRSFRPDVIVRESMEFAGAIAGAEAGIPVVRVATSNAYAEAGARSYATRPVEALRREAGLAADGGAALREALNFTFFPASVDGGAPADGTAPFRVRTTQAPLNPAGPGQAWAVDDGRPLVFVTFGTLAAGSQNGPGLFRTAVEAIAGLPARVLLSTGAEMGTAALGPLPANLTVTSWVGEGDVYPRASTLLCHGGAGTVLAGLSNGVPMAIAPISADQPENARCVEATGAGVAVPSPTAATLRAAIERTLSDASMRTAARRIAAEMTAMPGMDDAIREIERLR